MPLSRRFVRFFYASSETQGSPRGREKRRDGSIQARVEEPLAADSYRIISKRSSECWLLIGHKKCFVLLCPIGEQHRLSSFCVFVHDCYSLAVLYCTCPVRCSPWLFPNRIQHLLDCLTRLTAPGSPRIIFMLHFRKTSSSLVRCYLYSLYIFQV